MDRLTLSFSAFSSRARDWWNGQAASNRIAYVAVAFVLLLAFGLLAALRLHGPAYGVLFSNLPADEANAVLQKLDALMEEVRLLKANAKAQS